MFICCISTKSKVLLSLEIVEKKKAVWFGKCFFLDCRVWSVHLGSVLTLSVFVLQRPWIPNKAFHNTALILECHVLKHPLWFVFVDHYLYHYWCETCSIYKGSITLSLCWQSILLLGGLALSCLALDLLFLFFYSVFLCCRRSKNEEQPNADCCCTAWCVIIATLVCRLVCGFISWIVDVS